MNKVKILCICLLLLGFGDAEAQTPDYNALIKLLRQGIADKFQDKKSGLYYETTDSIPKENHTPGYGLYVPTYRLPMRWKF